MDKIPFEERRVIDELVGLWQTRYEPGSSRRCVRICALTNAASMLRFLHPSPNNSLRLSTADWIRQIPSAKSR